DRVGFFARDDDVFARGIDRKTARLLLRRDVSEPGELSARRIYTQPRKHVAGAFDGVQETAIGPEMQIGSPDVVVGVSRRLVRTCHAPGSSRHSRSQPG